MIENMTVVDEITRDDAAKIDKEFNAWVRASALPIWQRHCVKELAFIARYSDPILLNEQKVDLVNMKDMGLGRPIFDQPLLD